MYNSVLAKFWGELNSYTPEAVIKFVDKKDEQKQRNKNKKNERKIGINKRI